MKSGRKTSKNARALRGVVGALGVKDRRRFPSRAVRGGFGSGARNAMRKSVSPEGEEGVTMIAGKGDFSSTRGFERSEINGEQGSSEHIQRGAMV